MYTQRNLMFLIANVMGTLAPVVKVTSVPKAAVKIPAIRGES